MAAVDEQIVGVVEASTTGNPLVEVAVTMKVFPMSMPVGAAPNVMVCVAPVTAKFCVKDAAP